MIEIIRVHPLCVLNCMIFSGSMNAVIHGICLSYTTMYKDFRRCLCCGFVFGMFSLIFIKIVAFSKKKLPAPYSYRTVESMILLRDHQRPLLLDREIHSIIYEIERP